MPAKLSARACGQLSLEFRTFNMTWNISSSNANSVAANSIGLLPFTAYRQLSMRMEKSENPSQAYTSRCSAHKVRPTLLPTLRIQTRHGKSPSNQTMKTSLGRLIHHLALIFPLTRLDFETGSVFGFLEFDMLNQQRGGPILKYMKELAMKRPL